jgi:hypothetical protein
MMDLPVIGIPDSERIRPGMQLEAVEQPMTVQGFMIQGLDDVDEDKYEEAREHLYQ